jgi:1-acyl-sn-glycerol-3-phosphate acyltransferase
VKRVFSFLILLFLKILVRFFYRFDFRWVDGEPADAWGPYRILAILNHTSLFEWLFIGGVPVKFLWRISGHGLVPIADITLRRPIVGTFYRLLVPHLLPITRQADRTWKAVVDFVKDDLMVIILPEGRMKRLDGLDKEGRAMSVRGGIADIMQGMTEGKMLVAYSGGLHHVQAPGQHLPRIFRTLRMRLQEIDIAAYKNELDTEGDSQGFKQKVKRDLEARRDRYCPAEETL